MAMGAIAYALDSRRDLHLQALRLKSMVGNKTGGMSSLCESNK